MKLIFDANLSPKLVRLLDDVFPNSVHVHDQGVIASDDLLIWSFAKENGFTIVSKDSDFHRMSFVLGAPPKVIWVRVGNGSTSVVHEALRRNAGSVAEFDSDAKAAFLVLEV